MTTSNQSAADAASPLRASDAASTYVIYHGNCPDGFGGAWSAWCVLGDAAHYCPVSHGDPPPPLPSDASVLMIDFAFPREITLELRARVRDLVILDHHKSAQEEIGDLPYATFDMDRSGAMLAWRYCHPNVEPPALIGYVQDRDLWRFTLPNSREVTAALGSYPMDFQVWSGLDVADLAREGQAILRFRDQTVESIVGFARWGEIGGHRVPIVNATAHWSDVGEAMLKKYPDAPFVGAWFEDSEGTRRWSLRSRPDFDVSVVAKQLGGGGHRQASGFREPSRQRAEGEGQ
ncbi:MAG: DHHA1 domain-containing protein [Chloroflexota bacterium]